ncbi:MAG: hypothetical protein GVY04_23400 [Cyanobacteria bacterium]|nr:hypothetical protein [Cyanobacteria bacterium GSL.Bin1]
MGQGDKISTLISQDKIDRPLTNAQPRAQEFNSGVRLTPPTVGILQRQWEANEEDFADDEEYEEFTESAIASTSSLFRELTAQEQQSLDEMKALAEQASQRPDTKATELLNWINTHIRPDGNWSKQRVIMRAALKVNNIREDLGKVGPVIAAQVEEAMLGKRHQLDTSIAERDSEPVRRMLKFERQVRDQIEKLREQLQETRKSLHLTPDNIESVVKIGLDLAEQPPLMAVEAEKEVYRLPALKGSWASCSEGLAHPHSGEIRPISFNPDIVTGRDDVVLVHLNHRLVQMCLRLLRAEVWSNAKTSTRLHRVCAEIVPSSELESPAVIAYGRLLILGGDSQRLHEEVITAGGILKAGRFSRLNVMKIRQALQSVTGESVPEAMQQRLLALWETYQQPLLRSLEVRMEERTKGLEKALQERCEKEMSDVTTILQELADSIRQELASVNQPQQLEL